MSSSLPLEYGAFEGAIERIAQLWSGRTFFPGWKGSSWKDDMLSVGVPRAIWEQSGAQGQHDVIERLRGNAVHSVNHDPTIFSGAFPSAEFVRMTLGCRVPIDCRHSWFRQQTYDAMEKYAKKALVKLNQLAEPELSDLMTDTLQDLIAIRSPVPDRPLTDAHLPTPDEKILLLSDYAWDSLKILPEDHGASATRMIVAAAEAVIASLREALRGDVKVAVHGEMIFCYFPERSEFGRLCGLDTEEIAEFVEMCQSNVFTPQSRQRSPA